MSELAYCRRCGKELTGVIETTFRAVGPFVIITSTETTDCNWRNCHLCRKAICKQCYRAGRSVCSDGCLIAAVFRSHANPTAA